MASRGKPKINKNNDMWTVARGRLIDYLLLIIDYLFEIAALRSQ